MRIQGLREVTIQEAKNYSNQGYKVEVQATGQRILTKKFEGSEKLRLILVTLVKTIFTLGMLPIFSGKTQDQWKAFFSGKISIIPDQKFFETETGKTASKTHDKGVQLSGGKQAGVGQPLNNGKQLGSSKPAEKASAGDDKPLEGKKTDEPKESPKTASEEWDETKPFHLLSEEERAGTGLQAREKVAIGTLMRGRLSDWVEALANDKADELASLKAAKIDKEQFKRRLKERIAFLEKNIPDFRRKLEEKKNILPYLDLSDIELPLEQSTLKFALMDIQEVLSLQAKDLKSLNANQFDTVKRRIFEIQIDEALLARTLREDVSNQEFFKSKLNLADFLTLQPEELKNFANLIDPAFFSFLPIDKVAAFVNGYDFASLKLDTPDGQEKFKKMFPENLNLDSADTMKNIMQSLEPQQLAHCWKLLPGILIRSVSLKDVDCSQKEFQDRFDDLFPKGRGYYQKEETLINTLSPKQITDLWDRFDGVRMSYLSFEQIESLDLSNFKAGNNKDTERFQGLVVPQSGALDAIKVLERCIKIITEAIIPNKDNLHIEFRNIILNHDSLRNNLKNEEMNALK